MFHVERRGSILIELDTKSLVTSYYIMPRGNRFLVSKVG